MMEQDAIELCGPRYGHKDGKAGYRWGKTQGKIGFCGGKDSPPLASLLVEVVAGIPDDPTESEELITDCVLRSASRADG